MLDKIKAYLSYASGLTILVLSALLFRKSHQQDATQSELAHEKTTTEIKLNDEAREAAHANADELLANYERLKRSRDRSE